MQFIQLISSALPVVHRVFSSFKNKTTPITAKPTVLRHGAEHILFSVSNELFFKVKVTVGVGSLHHLSYVLKQMVRAGFIYTVY